MTEHKAIDQLETASDRWQVVLVGVAGEFYREMKPFLSALKEERGSRLVLICKTRQDAEVYKNEGFVDAAYPLSDALRSDGGMSNRDILQRAGRIEEEYKTQMHYHLVDKRRFYTASLHYPTAQMNSSYEDLLAETIRTFDYFEKIVQEEKVTLVINPTRILDEVATRNGIAKRHLHECLYKGRLYWFENFARESSRFEPQFASIPEPAELEPVVVETLPSYQRVKSQVRPSIQPVKLVRSMLREIARAAWYNLKGYDKAKVFGFRTIANTLYPVRRAREFSKLKRLAKATPDDLAKVDYIFLPLGGEPESTIATSSPEMMDQLFLVQTLARELPVGTYLAVKEHLVGIGCRPRDFYEIIASMPNVMLVDPDVSGVDVVRGAKAVAVIGSTVAIEAAVSGIPALSFGAHNFFNFVPHVTAINGWHEVRPVLQKALNASDEEREQFRKDGQRLATMFETYAVEPVDKGDKNSHGKNLLAALEKSFVVEPGI